MTMGTFSLAQPGAHELALTHRILSAGPVHHLGRRGGAAASAADRPPWPTWARRARLTNHAPAESYFCFLTEHCMQQRGALVGNCKVFQPILYKRGEKYSCLCNLSLSKCESGSSAQLMLVFF